VIAETFVVGRSRYSPSDFFQATPRWRWPAFASWFPGTALYFVIVWFGLPIGATLPSFALAAGLHVVLSKVEQGSARSSPLVSGGDPLPPLSPGVELFPSSDSEHFAVPQGAEDDSEHV